MYKLRPTTRFQKDLKRIQKRGYDLSLLTEVLKNWQMGKLFQRRTEIIRLQEAIQDAGNVMWLRIGCSFTRSVMMS